VGVEVGNNVGRALGLGEGRRVGLAVGAVQYISIFTSRIPTSPEIARIPNRRVSSR
jgi:hypothetical protein